MSLYGLFYCIDMIAFHITMDECLAEFSEEYCFSRQVAGPNDPDCWF